MSQATLLLHQPDAKEEPQPGSSGSPKRAQFVAIAVVLVLIAVWFAPAFLARSALRHRLVHAVFPSYPGIVSVGRASLGWIAPVVLEDVVLRDADGHELLHVEQFRTSKNLFSLLARRSQGLGTLTLVRPRLSVRLERDGSNVEETLRPLLEEPGSNSSFTILVTNGELGWTSLGGETVIAGLKGVAASVERGASANGLDVELTGELTDGEHRGTLALRTERSDANDQRDHVSCVADDVPLGALQPWLDRYSAGLEVTGTGSADVIVAIPQRDDVSWTVDGRVAAQKLRLSDRVSDTARSVFVEEASLAGRASGSGSRLDLQRVELQSDLLNANASGKFDLARWTSSNWSDAVETFLANDLSLHGSANLAQIAMALPESVRLHQPVRSGILTFDVTTDGTASDHRGTLHLATSDLVAGPAENPVVWQKPLAVDVSLRRNGSGFLVEQARIDSEFLQLSGSGSANGADLTFSTDLDRLRELVTRFVDLPATSLAGRAEGHLVAHRAGADAPLDVTANATVRDWQIDLMGRKWSERELQIESAGRIATVSESYTVESGHVELKSVEGDAARVELRRPLQISDLPQGSFAVSARGSSRRWLDRARALSFVPQEPAWSLDGEMSTAGQIDASEPQIRATNVVLEAKQFRLVTHAQTFDESYLNYMGDVTWDRVAGRIASTASKLECESAAIDAKNVRWSFEEASCPSGHFQMRGGIGRLARYAMPARPPVWISGVIAGTVNVTSEPQATVFGAEFDLERPLLTTPTHAAAGAVTWAPFWSDESAHIAIKGRYHSLTDALDVTALQVKSSGLSFVTKGRVDQLALVASADLSGTITYDWPVFAKHVAAWPQDVVVQGQGTTPFVVRGPLVSVEGIDPALVVETAFGWQSLIAWGMSFDRGELPTRLERKTLSIGPFACAVANGQARGSANLPLTTPWPLRIAPGKVVENVELSPELCRKWLRYAAPMLADATTVEGKASLGVASGVVPLAAPSAAEGEATMRLENLDATPGPLARSLINVIGQVQRIAGREPTQGSDLRLVAPQQAVGLKMSNERVYHDRFAVQLGDADGPVVTTSGSVGLDESLDLVVTVPLEKKWFKDERIAAALGGQSLRIPVHGTLSNPAPDPRALQDFARRAATGAVNGFLNREIEKQLGDPLRKLLDR